MPRDKANTQIIDATALVESLDVTEVNLFIELCILEMWKPWDGRPYKYCKELLNYTSVKYLSLSLIIHILCVFFFCENGFVFLISQ